MKSVCWGPLMGILLGVVLGIVARSIEVGFSGTSLPMGVVFWTTK